MDAKALARITQHADEGAELRRQFFAQAGPTLVKAAFASAKSLVSGGKILLCGNGGSAADAQHIAGEFVNRFLVDRGALPAIALTTDTSVITAIANDSAFTRVFARQVEALGQPGDILLAISTSGKSENILEALAEARKKGLLTIALTGEGGGRAAAFSDMLLAVPSRKTPLIQEVHLACEHLYCELVDYYLFDNVTALGA